MNLIRSLLRDHIFDRVLAGLRVSRASPPKLCGRGRSASFPFLWFWENTNGASQIEGLSKASTGIKSVARWSKELFREVTRGSSGDRWVSFFSPRSASSPNMQLMISCPCTCS